jgi:uncharacterized protein (TIGR00251 family)
MGKQTLLSVRITPNAKRNQLIGFKDNFWNIKIAAPAVEGKANHELIKYLSQMLDKGISCIDIQKGHNSRLKILCVDGLDMEEIVRRLLLKQC